MLYTVGPVSYTHLDVYKRQSLYFTVHRDVCDPDHSAVVTVSLSGYFSRPPADSPDPFYRADVVSSISRLRPKRAPRRGSYRCGSASTCSPQSYLTGSLFSLALGVPSAAFGGRFLLYCSLPCLDITTWQPSESFPGRFEVPCLLWAGNSNLPIERSLKLSLIHI